MRLIATAPHELRWEEVETRPLAADEVLVKTLWSAVSVASELSAVRDGPFPRKLGYQTVGIIENVGEDVGFQVGQRVVTMLGHANHGIHKTSRVFPVPDHISDRQALCLILGEETQKGIRKVSPQPHERVLIAGAGLLGLLTVFNLTSRGVHDVTVLEPDAERRTLALEFGAAEVYPPGHLPHSEFDVGIECSASPAGFSELLEYLRPGGRCGVLSDGNWGALKLTAAFHQRELSVVASSDGEDYHAYAAWLWNHAVPVLEQLFQQVIQAEELLNAYARLCEFPRPVSVLVDWSLSGVQVALGSA